MKSIKDQIDSTAPHSGDDAVFLYVMGLNDLEIIENSSIPNKVDTI